MTALDILTIAATIILAAVAISVFAMIGMVLMLITFSLLSPKPCQSTTSNAGISSMEETIKTTSMKT